MEDWILKLDPKTADAGRAAANRWLGDSPAVLERAGATTPDAAPVDNPAG